MKLRHRAIQGTRTNISFDNLLKYSPYPVEYDEILIGKVGSFWWGECSDKKPYTRLNFEPHIEISSERPEIERTATLLHEIGHAIHYRRHCICYIEQDIEKRRYLAELHTYRFSLRFMVRYKMIEELKGEYNNMVNSPHGQIYRKVINQIKSEKIWGKIENLLGVKRW